MGGTFSNLQYHIVFSTKGRRPFIADAFSPRLYEYIGGTIRKHEGVLYEIGGPADHVHLLLRWRPNGSVSDSVRDIKSASSGWIHKNFPDKSDFQWQDGFGAFSVSHSQSGRLTRYILNQERHHRQADFQAEFRALLQAHEIEFDEEYIWL